LLTLKFKLIKQFEGDLFAQPGKKNLNGKKILKKGKNPNLFGTSNVVIFKKIQIYKNWVLQMFSQDFVYSYNTNNEMAQLRTN